MPNHIANLITAEGGAEEMGRLRALLENEKGEVDFNRLIPMPTHSEDFIAEGGLGAEEMAKPNWYNWSCDNWGTKWNAYTQKMDDERIYFETAWAVPDPIVRKLAEVSKGLRWTWRYADEDYGRNYGVFRFDGKALSVEVEHLGNGTDAEIWAAGLHRQEEAFD
jgi:hypothetical protein